MAEPLKNCYNSTFFERLRDAFSDVYPDFEFEGFLTMVFDETWQNRELKERMHHIADAMKFFLPVDPGISIPLVVNLSDHLAQNNPVLSFAYMFLPDFVERSGLEDFEISIKAMEKITQFTSCEFAVRPFILKYGKRMMDQMQAWSKHRHPHVRRLASEGCRPRLPWAMSLDFLKKDPSPVFPILENLKVDPSEFVRKSVANHINDISRDHPRLVIDLVKKWKGKSNETDWILKHGSRTLLKAGNAEILPLFQLQYNPEIKIDHFEILTPMVDAGKDLHFRFTLRNNAASPKKIRVEYFIYHLLSNGNYSRKIFKITEKDFNKTSETEIVRKHSFRPITTRKYYPGVQKISIVINGQEFPPLEFDLL